MNEIVTWEFKTDCEKISSKIRFFICIKLNYLFNIWNLIKFISLNLFNILYKISTKIKFYALKLNGNH